MRKFLKFVAVLIAATLVAGLCFLGWAYYASTREPDFYREALRIVPEIHAEAGDQFEQKVLELRNDLIESPEQGGWEMVFTDRQINGWLALDLPEKFPKALPKQISDPRVVIQPAEAQLACRYVDSKISSVLSVALDVRLTNDPNVIAVRVMRARAGTLPLPLKPWLDQISAAARKAEIDLRWEQKEGDPVALVTIPQTHEEFRDSVLFVDEIELRDGEVYISGRIETADGEAINTADLRGNLFQLLRKR